MEEDEEKEKEKEVEENEEREEEENKDEEEDEKGIEKVRYTYGKHLPQTLFYSKLFIYCNLSLAGVLSTFVALNQW